MTTIPFVLFWVLLFLARRRLGQRGILFAIGTWVVLLWVAFFAQASPYLFVAAQALIDAVLLTVVLGGNVRLR